MTELIAIVLAAGHGTRMKSSLPKVLHPLCGRPMVYYPIHAAISAGASRVVVVANPSNHHLIETELARHFSPHQFSIALQEVPCGTGDAARAGVSDLELAPDDQVLILSGDVPLISSHNLRPLLRPLEERSIALCFMTFQAEDPTGYGRVLRDEDGNPREIREHRDLSNEAERQVTEVNAGVYAAKFGPMLSALANLSPNNVQGEFYLTDIVATLARNSDVRTVTQPADVLLGVNDRSQLATVEKALFARIRERLGQEGVTLVGTPLIDDTVQIASEVRIEESVRLRGNTTVGARTLVDVGCVVENSTIGEDTTVKPYCCVTDSHVGNHVQLGPFAHLRPESIVEDHCHIGNFVETKKSHIKKGAKANHLSYLGDTEVGELSNIGAGTIVCNYDGYQKRRTVIGREVFVGSDSQLVAPVTIGDRAYVATSTTVTKDVPEGALAIGRARQQNKEGYADALRERLAPPVKK